MSTVGYARTATQDQHSVEAQTDALTQAGCERIFSDQASGMLASRPGLDGCLECLDAGDVLVVTRLDRLGRSVKNLAELVGLLREQGIDVRVLDEGVDTASPDGWRMLDVMLASAEVERS